MVFLAEIPSGIGYKIELISMRSSLIVLWGSGVAGFPDAAGCTTVGVDGPAGLASLAAGVLFELLLEVVMHRYIISL